MHNIIEEDVANKALVKMINILYKIVKTVTYANISR